MRLEFNVPMTFLFRLQFIRIFILYRKQINYSSNEFRIISPFKTILSRVTILSGGGSLDMLRIPSSSWLPSSTADFLTATRDVDKIIV